MVKIGVSYNIFSGLELLEGSIERIKDHVDHINVVYQVVSNTGTIKTEIHDFVRYLYHKGLIDSANLFHAYDGATPKQNETRKRNIGLEVCRDKGCTHFLSMDTDEYYDPDQFKQAIDLVIQGGYSSSACKMQTYYKSIEYRLSPPEEYYVPFLYKIDDRSFINGQQWPVKADPSRKMRPDKMKIFSRNELEMHHLSYVRTDIREKLYNASSSVNFKDRLEEIADYYDNWTYPMPAYLGGSKKRMMSVEKI